MSGTDEPGEPSVILSEEYDSERNEAVSLRVIRLVAIASDRQALDLDPLGYVIDTDALDRLLQSKGIDDPHTQIGVSFEYEGYLVEIDTNGTVRILVEG